MNPATVWRSGALLTAVGMTAGAFGSHGLRARYPDPQDRSHTSWATASHYLIYNGLALLAISFHPVMATRKGRIATSMILAGAGSFSGTIFGLVLAREKVGKVFGPLTPIGGAAMIAGYVMLAF